MQITAELLKNARNGDRKAQNLLYRQCFALLMAICVRYKRDQQEAVSSVNAGFLKILNNLERYNAEVPFEAWARRIMINTVIDEFRREKKWRDQTLFSDTIERAYDREPLDWNEADQRLDAEQLEAMLQRLPPMTRQVFNLFALDGFSHQEIGSMLNISDGTSKWHVNNARKMLQAWIKAEALIET